jgi:hypothetical protein
VDTAMVAGMAPDGRAKALVHSGGALLTVDQVADAAVGMLGTSRVVRSLPSWRAVMMRFTSLTPSVTMKAEKVFLWDGRRRMRAKR